MIRVYALEGGGTVEVLQGANDPDFKTIGEVPSDKIIKIEDWSEKTVGSDEALSRIVTTPGAFIGLPTPRFHK